MSRVLIVDDDEHGRLFLATVLKTLNYEVVQAPTALEGLGLMDAGMAFDLLITDLLMPVIDGTSFIKLVRQQQPQLPIIVVSAHLPDGDAGQILLERVLVLRKPLSYQQVAEAVKRTFTQ
jgi:CheY-like chemotaxis protein